MVPFGLSQEQFVKRYRRCLERCSAQLIEELRELLARPVPDTVQAAEVQIFLGEDGDTETAAWIYYNGKNNKVDNHDQSIFPGRSLDLSLGLETWRGLTRSIIQMKSLMA